ncbi:hypothetical protein JX265_003479 [Neoarthrinium moseri]|uniref:Meiotically up-regulated gene 154 protein n=1 Tax=Neoarthrinium moseri TaxID=1658444 RepID=A0A9P9WS95_9PEZI|nr:uncharacterized protein JN550_002226 [Neoarthrinium moseri]KAI1850106.1 hypothetical protein JX266_004485 [Neoarthrinium moseri]KAI1874797.1 hypothetical protein JN550_002226 [Neoarthrinium moseri]KAI1877471.1 hypothetical protein JX265_003479 [Neoarthrinium moseri]
MPRLVRRKPLFERIKAMLNPMDLLLALSEEIETREWNSQVVGTQMGLVMNFVFLVARANSSLKSKVDDVFGDGDDLSYMKFVFGTLAWCLAGFAVLNSVYTINRTRKYRLFEADVEKEYDTPSAQRVRVQSSPASASPLRFLADMVSSESAESRAHPDRTRDVWELSIWDPLPIGLQIFCLFSPGHILVYWMFIPLAPMDPRPSVTIFNCLLLQVILSAQLLLLQSRFSQQNKDTAIIQKEVMHEYDTKFVHPRLYPTVRDAATQLSVDDDGNDQEYVQVGTPQTLLRRGFKTNPNPNYVKHIDPDGTPHVRSSTPNTRNPGLFTPPVARQSDVFSSSINSRPAALMRRSTPGFASSLNATPSHSISTSTTTQTQTQTQAQPQGNGGYLGVYTHPSSPLKKAPSLGDLHHRTPRNNSEMAQLEQYQAYSGRERSSSPMKSARKSTGTLPSATQTGPNPWMRNNRQSYERYPSMWR